MRNVLANIHVESIMISWRSDVEEIPEEGEILIWSKTKGLQHVEWRLNDCGYTVPWENWCVVGTMGTEMAESNFSHWAVILSPFHHIKTKEIF